MATDELKRAKRLLRRTMVARILELPESRRAVADEALQGRCPSIPGFASAGALLLYARAFPEEIETLPLLRLVLESGRRLVLPRVDRSEGGLILHEVTDLENHLVPGSLGILEPCLDRPIVEPTGIDWVLVPGIAFDVHGHRLGRGAGHYDRLLPRLRPGVPRWALAYDCQLLADLPTGPRDVPVDGIASPGGLFGPAADPSFVTASAG